MPVATIEKMPSLPPVISYEDGQVGHLATSTGVVHEVLVADTVKDNLVGGGCVTPHGRAARRVVRGGYSGIGVYEIDSAHQGVVGYFGSKLEPGVTNDLAVERQILFVSMRKQGCTIKGAKRVVNHAAHHAVSRDAVVRKSGTEKAVYYTVCPTGSEKVRAFGATAMQQHRNVYRRPLTISQPFEFVNEFAPGPILGFGDQLDKKAADRHLAVLTRKMLNRAINLETASTPGPC